MKKSTLPLLKAASCLALIAFFLPSMASAQNGASHHEPAANFDRRSHAATNAASRSAKSPAAAARDSDEATLRSRIKHVRVDRDELTGAPVFVASPHGFLTEPDGAGPAIPAMSRRATSNDPQEVVKAFVDAYPGLFGHGSDTLTAARVARDYVTAHNGMRTINWEQVVDGIRVFEAGFQAHITRRNELVNVSGRMIPNPEQAAEHGGVGRSARVALPSVTARAAVVLAAANLGAEMAEGELVEQTRPEGAEMRQQFQGPLLTDADVRYVWLPMDGETLRLCWEIIGTTRSDGFMYRVIVDADTGEVQLRQSLTESISNASYRVFTSDSPSPFSPGLATPSTYQPPLVPRTLVTTAALNPIASPNGWIDDGVMETRGNNVDAHTDIDANNVADLPRPQAVGPDRVFDPPLDLTQEPSTYRDAAVVNLFYWCNWMHDKLYELGFTEAAGNFQVNNFGRGGIGNDAVQADAQDGSGTDNANFSTPPDGGAGRMQMYVFTGAAPDRDGDFDAEIVLHEYTHGLSNRLVGGGVGMSALQSKGMGEGWSDFYALSLLSEAGDDVDGGYASGGYATYQFRGLTQNYYFGIRRYPYSSNLAVNPLTLKDIDPAQASPHSGVPISPIAGGPASEVHNMGEVWCAVLWDARANLVKKHGFSAGNQLMLQLVTDGMKLSPANPNFLQARDAIIQADLVDTGGANRWELWSAFAKRGMGASAFTPVSSTTVGLMEAYDLPDSLVVNPTTPITVTGLVGGPFAPQTYTLSNPGATALTWSASKTQTWTDITPASGTLTAGESTTVTVSFNGAANGLPFGSYSEVLTFTNVSTGAPQPRALTLLVAAPPTITSFTPTVITSGMTVTIDGTNFVAPAAVFFNGIGSTAVNVISSTQITALVPSGITNGPISVNTPGGTASSPTNYTVSAAPIITGFTPTSGPTKRMITVTGFNFFGGAVTSRTVRVNGVSVSSSTVSATQLIFPVPVGATTGPITVTTNLGVGTSATNFVVAAGAPPPNDNFANAQVISGSSGLVSVGNTNATRELGEPRHGGSIGGASIWYSWTAPTSGAYLFQPPDAGLNMGVVQGIYVGDSVDALAFVGGGSANSPFSRYPSCAAFFATAGTTYRIAFDGYDGLMGEFYLTWAPLAAPTITSFPGSAYPGQSFIISGTGFAPGASVTIGGVPVPSGSISYGSPGVLTVNQLPANAVTGPIAITTVAGTAVSGGNLTVSSAPAPSISSVSPVSGIVGASVTINGTALSLGDTTPPVVRFNGVPVATITSQSSTSLTVRVPTGATSGPITVQTAQGTATAATNFTVTTSSNPTPFIFGFSPSGAPVGAPVVLSGANYTGVTSVQLNGASVPFAINSANQITVTIPVGATSGTFRTIAGSASATSATSFQVTTPPSITGFAPTAVTSGMSVVISGANFSGVTGVAFNGVSAAFAVNSNTQITATVPSGALVPGPITVTTLDGVSSSAMSFTIAADTPSITSFTPAVLSSRQQVVITGANFNDVVSVFFNGMPGSFTVDSSSRITAVAPAGVTAGSIVVTTTKGSATAPILYTIAAPAVPSISDFSPAAIASGLAVTINGAGFSNVTSVRFNGVSANYVVLSPNQLVATAPSSLTAGPITVTTSLGTTSSATAYTLTLAPIITSFTPTSAPVNRVISVSGANFSGGSIGNVVVRINGVQVLSQSRSGNTITFPIPVGATTGPITVTTNQGTATSAASLVVESGPPPANDSFANARIISGTSGFTSGNTANATKEFGEPNHGGNPGGASVWFTWTAPVSGFYLFNPYDASSSQFGILQSIYTGDSLNALTLVASGQPATSVFARFGSAAVLNATAGVTYRIALDGYNGVMANYRLTWTPLSPPFITSFNPTSAAAGQNLNVSVSGSGFAPGAIVSLGGAQVDPARITYSSSGSLTISQIPANAVTGPITVTTVAGTATSASNFVIILPAPTITSFPTGAAVGATITITGTNFGGTLAVKFNGIDAVGFTVDPSGQTITATVPVGATTGPISVVTPGGTAVSSVPFIVVTPPVITQQPVSQTATVGETVSFTVSATSNGPLEYWWLKDGKPLLTNPTADHATLVLTNITAADMGVYVCQVGNTAAILKTIPATLTVNKATATVTLSGLTATYDGTPKPVPATTVPSNLQVQITYNGSATPPTNAGSYAVAAEIIDPNYFGSTTGTLLVNPALATVTFSGLSAVFDGTPRAVTVVTVPAGLGVKVTYNGSTTPPTNVGSYAVAATVINPNYAGGAIDTQTIKPASASIALANLVQIYDGTPRPVTVTTTPAGLATTVTYNGSTVAPTYPGTFAVAAAIDDPNYSGSTTGSLVISATVTVRHAPALNGGIDGSLQVLLPESAVLNGNAWISSDLLVPGTPNLLLNGHPVLVGTKDATGNMNPSSFQVVLNGNAALRYLVRRVDAIALPVVTPPPAPAGGRNVALNNARDLVGDFATLRDLTLNGNAGEIVVPPGTYGRFTANAHTAFVLGIAGASEPAIYNLQSLTLNGAAELKVVGPVVVTVADNVIAAGDLGDSTHPQWFTLRVATGGVTLNGVANLAGEVLAPNGSVVIGSGKIVGNVTADRLTLNGNGVIEQRPQ